MVGMSWSAFAFIGSLAWTEILVILAAALMIFGGNLPDVALRLVAQVMRARRAVAKMWRDTGLEDELRRVRRDVEMSIPRDADFDMRPNKVNEARRAAERSRTAALREAESSKAPRLGEPVHDDSQSGGASHGGPENGGREGTSVSGNTPNFDPAEDPDAERRESYLFEPADPIASGDDYMPADAGVDDAADVIDAGLAGEGQKPDGKASDADARD